MALNIFGVHSPLIYHFKHTGLFFTFFPYLRDIRREITRQLEGKQKRLIPRIDPPVVFVPLVIVLFSARDMEARRPDTQ